jgi:hypothetical protein
MTHRQWSERTESILIERFHTAWPLADMQGSTELHGQIFLVAALRAIPM